MAVKLHTNQGEITIELDEERAPESARNFLAYVESGHYDNTVFHRVIRGFMIQGGGFEPGMKQKPTGEPIQNEAANGLKNVRGSLAMARTNAPHSATAQFFINVADNAFLDYPGQDGWGYAVFGKVTEGMDIVDKIEATKTGNRGFHADVPVDDILIQKAEIV
ncbi:MAG: peptidyl-prolyl cis-trans isomerase [Rhodocyclaceae bacterium]|nr:peptidyl-prolyl cis-trans isomerase [Rhodocyclaceae bacterium]